MLTFCYVFVFPDSLFQKLVEYEYLGWSAGYLPVVVLGFISDDIFVLFPALISMKLRAFAEKRLGISLNGKPKRLPEDFPQ